MTEVSTKVLVVEEDAEKVAYLQGILSASSSIEFIGAPNLNVTLEKLRDLSYDLVLWNLSERQPHDLNSFLELRIRFPQIPLIVLANPQEEKIAQLSLKYGAQDYLVKGRFNGEWLLRTLRNAIDKKRTEEELKKEKNFESAIVETVGALIVVLDRQGGIVKFNQACERISGYSFQEVKGKCLWDLFILPEETKSVKETFENLRSGGLHNQHLNYWVTKTGQHRLISWSNTTLFNEEGLVEYVIGTGIDVTEEKKVEQMKEEFISTVSHEMRTPLTIIKGSISNLQNGIAGPLNEKQEKVLETTARNADRLARIVSDILDLSRLESGKAHVEMKPIEINQLTEEVFQQFQNIAEKKGLSLKKEISSALPNISADHDLLFQVFNNLLDNALRFAHKEILIQIIPQRNNGQAPKEIEFHVIDDGPGIAPEHLPKLFNKFEQIQRPSGGSGYKGTGLGLAICKKIVELHHGAIGAKSQVGKGCEFYFSLPLEFPPL